MWFITCETKLLFITKCSKHNCNSLHKLFAPHTMNFHRFAFINDDVGLFAVYYDRNECVRFVFV